MEERAELFSIITKFSSQNVVGSGEKSLLYGPRPGYGLQLQQGGGIEEG